MGFLLEITKPDFVTRKEDKKKRQKVRKRKRKKKICEDIDIQEKKKFIRISLWTFCSKSKTLHQS